MRQLSLKTIILIIIHIGSVLGLSAQDPSKRETVDWIVKKLNDYSTHMGNETEFLYDYSDDELKCFTSSSWDEKFTKVIVLKLKDINSVSFNYINSSLTINTEGKLVKHYSRIYHKGDRKITEILDFNVMGMSLQIDFDKEEKLLERLRSAFKRLFTFYPKEKEAF